MLFILTEDKELKCTVRKLVYKYETGADEIKILIPQKYQEMECVVQCLLPDGKNGLYKYCQYETELYKERLVVSVPITTTVTKDIGEIKVWVMLLKRNADDENIADFIEKSSMSSFNVYDSKSLDGLSEESFDEIWEHTSMAMLLNKIENKADSMQVVGNELQLKSGDDVINSVILSDDVMWKEWV